MSPAEIASLVERARAGGVAAVHNKIAAAHDAAVGSRGRRVARLVTERGWPVEAAARHYGLTRDRVYRVVKQYR